MCIKLNGNTKLSEGIHAQPARLLLLADCLLYLLFNYNVGEENKEKDQLQLHDKAFCVVCVVL